ncbi:MAG: terminase, partial [Candidatus Aminicenantes bacterium]
MGALDEVMERIRSLPAEQQKAVIESAIEATKAWVWVPNTGPQTEAYYCEADELLFGGEAGGGKTDLVIGLALVAHRRSLVLRRTNKEAENLVDRFQEIIGTRDGWNSQTGVWRIGERIIDIGGCQLEDDKQKRKGIPHDLKAFDELVDFSKSQYEFIIAWNRSTDPNQRCRIVATSNPPTRPEGLWVIDRWGAWLDPKHPRPAKDGELRWYTTINDVDTEVDGPGPHMVDGEPVMAKSRTFIRSQLVDNPDLARTDYAARLAALPKELRAAYHGGKFDSSLQDAPNQAVPTSWVRMAFARWSPDPPAGVPMCTMGVDASGGGEDPMTIAIRHDGWYAPIVKVPGKELPVDRLGAYAAGVVISYRRDSALVVVDLGGGYGGSMYEHLKANDVDVNGYKGAEASTRRSRDAKLKFTNKRSAAYWVFREALDPGQPQGSPIALCEDQALLAELTAPTFEVTPNGIKVEPKDKVCERLGRSTDHADAVVMAWFEGPKETSHALEWADQREARRPRVKYPKV